VLVRGGFANALLGKGHKFAYGGRGSASVLIGGVTRVLIGGGGQIVCLQAGVTKCAYGGGSQVGAFTAAGHSSHQIPMLYFQVQAPAPMGLTSMPRVSATVLIL
jgi:hypothetical protein